MRDFVTAIFAVMVMVVVIGAPLLHNIIPHTHGGGSIPDGVITHTDGESGNSGQTDKETLVWSNLHSALRHEDKKLLIAALAIISFSLFAAFRILVIFSTGLVLIALSDGRLLRVFDPHYGRYLTRGIAAYRRFA